jgi:hypothetical protein
MYDGLGVSSVPDPRSLDRSHDATLYVVSFSPSCIMIRDGDRSLVPCLLTRVRDGNKNLFIRHQSTLNRSVRCTVLSLSSRQNSAQGRWASLKLWDKWGQTWRRHHHLVDDYILGSAVRKSRGKAREKTHQRQNCRIHHCSSSIRRYLSR